MGAVEPHLVIVSHYAPRSKAAAIQTWVSCCRHGMPHAILIRDDDVGDMDDGRYLPWFMLDQVAEMEPHSVLYLRAGMEMASPLLPNIHRILQSDVVLFHDADGEPMMDAICVSNTDKARNFLDTWIQINDENPDIGAATNLGVAAVKYSRIMKLHRMPAEILHHRSVACTI